MHHLITRFTAATVLAALLCASPASAQGEQEMSPKEKAMMEAWAKASTPNENHQRLAQFERTWHFTSRWWVEPGAELFDQGPDGVEYRSMEIVYSRK